MSRRTFSRRVEQIERLMYRTWEIAEITSRLRKNIRKKGKNPNKDILFNYMEDQRHELYEILLSHDGFASRCRGVTAIRRRFYNYSIEDGQLVKSTGLFDDD